MDIVNELKKIPPVTRFLTGSLLGVSVSVLMGAVSPYTVLFHYPMVVRRVQVSLIEFDIREGEEADITMFVFECSCGDSIRLSSLGVVCLFLWLSIDESLS